jgi:hypothetical protein
MRLSESPDIKNPYINDKSSKYIKQREIDEIKVVRVNKIPTP